jgi:hypothetical protein
LGIYLLLLLYAGSSIKDEVDNYGVNILTSMIWRLLFPNGDIKAEMVPPP